MNATYLCNSNAIDLNLVRYIIYSYLYLYIFIDLIDHGSFFNLASEVSNVVKDKGLNVLINNAGISTKFTRIGLVKSDDLLNNLKINTIGPIMLTQVKYIICFILVKYLMHRLLYVLYFRRLYHY